MNIITLFHNKHCAILCFMKKLKLTFKIILILISISSVSLQADDANNTIVLKVGTKIAPPFAMKTPDGKWEGISIELWDLIAKKLGIKYELQERDLAGLLSDIANKKLDIGIAAITITPDREKVMDFSHSYYTTWLSIAVPKKKDNLQTLIKSIFTLNLLFIVLAILSSLVVIGVLIWFTEHKKNPDVFDPNPVKGIGNAIWWAAATMTFLGDKNISLKTVSGRVIALFWMITSFILLASIIAAFTFILTQNNVDGKILSEKDLNKGKIATVSCSVSEHYLNSKGIYPKIYTSIQDGLASVINKKSDAMVYDAPLLKYYINKKFSKNLVLIDRKFEAQNYSIAMQEGSPLQEKINRALLEIIFSKQWQKILHKYLDN